MAEASSSAPRLDLKVILLGDAGVGKTCAVNRYTESRFTPNSPSTAGASFRYKVALVDGVRLTLGLWDTAGQARFDNLQSFYCRGARAAVVCYDITERASFEHAESWVARVRREAEAGCVLAVVGTKLDLAAEAREVAVDEAAAFAERHGALFFETSALSGAKVTEVFNAVMEAYLKAWRKRSNSHQRGGGGEGVAAGSRAPLLGQQDDAGDAGGKCCCAVQ